MITSLDGKVRMVRIQANLTKVQHGLHRAVAIKLSRHLKYEGQINLRNVSVTNGQTYRWIFNQHRDWDEILPTCSKGGTLMPMDGSRGFPDPGCR